MEGIIIDHDRHLVHEVLVVLIIIIIMGMGEEEDLTLTLVGLEAGEEVYTILTED